MVENSDIKIFYSLSKEEVDWEFLSKNRHLINQLESGLIELPYKEVEYLEFKNENPLIARKNAFDNACDYLKFKQTVGNNILEIEEITIYQPARGVTIYLYEEVHRNKDIDGLHIYGGALGMELYGNLVEEYNIYKKYEYETGLLRKLFHKDKYYDALESHPIWEDWF
jgi:hypothetical protein